MKDDAQRLEALQGAMRRLDCVALLATEPTDVLLLTGYWPVMGSSIAVATADGRVSAIVPSDEQELAQATSTARIIPYEPETLQRLTTPAEALREPMQDLLAELGLKTAAVGLAMGETGVAAGYQTLHLFRDSIQTTLHAVLPGLKLTDASQTFHALKGRLTTTELGALRHASKLSAAGFKAAEGAIAAGRREDEVAAEINAAFDVVANDGFQRGLGFYFCMSGPNSAKAAGAYAQTRQRTLQTGDLVMIHTNTAGDGYWTDVTRTYVVGERSDRQQRMYDAIAEAREAALKAIRPGVATKLVDAAARDVLRRHGFGPEFKHAAGHGVGFAATNPNALPRIHPESPDVLEAGMTFNIEPAIYFDGWGGMRHCDVIACTESGAEVLTDF